MGRGEGEEVFEACNDVDVLTWADKCFKSDSLRDAREHKGTHVGITEEHIVTL
ncbi:hypothetical protein QJS10_CPB20g00853 [Acorus calamus]|uniref:Uncharacterized protein n=1 Tax=Acorus calamus TaxID=4465 RepID=A0AAV9CCE6_ACOCL|nr:hypothetical protein QJS10_CPB20g00853 [Acorus calamus]